MIPFVDLKAQTASIRDEIDQAIAGVLDSCQFTLGQEVASFEQEFANYCATDHAVAVNTGTSALHLALLAAEIGPGDEVITVPNTFVATVAAICYTGARPVFVDINPDTMNIDVDRIEQAVNSKTKAILPVHLYGQPADMDPIMRVAKEHGLRVIEDAAQAHGAEYKDKRIGSIADLGCFSFYPGKNLGACGEGGMVTTKDKKLADRVRMLRDWGMEEKYHHDLLGYNYRMEGIQGAVLRVKLRHLEAWTEARRQAAAYYDELLTAVAVSRPGIRDDVRHVYHLYIIRAINRDALQKKLAEQDIQSGIHYPVPVHLQKGYAMIRNGAGDFPHSEKAAEQILSLPMFAEISREQIRQVVETTTAFIKNQKGV